MTSSNALAERLDFIRLTPAALEDIKGVKSIIMQELPGALDRVYEQVRNTPQARKFFKGAADIAGAKSQQLDHWDVISSGRLDERYVSAATTVGEVHAKIGLEPRWYIGGYALVLDALIGRLLAARWPKGGFGIKTAGPRKTAAELSAVVKAALLDMDLSISVHLEALEAAHSEADAQRRQIEEEQNRVVETLAESLRKLADGDLTTHINAAFAGAHEQIKNNFNAAVETLRGAIDAISGATGALRSGSDWTTTNLGDAPRRAAQRADSLEDAAAAIDQIAAAFKRSAEGAAQVFAAGVDAVPAPSQIEQSNRQITRIIEVIDEIAFQTNLLALARALRSSPRESRRWPEPAREGRHVPAHSPARTAQAQLAAAAETWEEF